MKKIHILYTLLCFSLIVKAQDPLGKYFEFTSNIRLNHCDPVGAAVPGSEIIMGGIQFKVVATTGSDYVISILIKPGDNSFNARYYHTAFATAGAGFVAPPVPDIYFILPNALFKSICKPRLVKNSFTIGLVNLPLKMRFGKKDKIDGKYDRNFLVSSDVSLGFSVGYKRQWNENWGINFLGGVGLSTIQVDSSLTKGFTKSASNAAAVTGHAGVLIEVNNFQFGVFTGIDFLTGQVGRNWIYGRKPWLGLAIGFSLFKTKSTTDTQ